MFKIYPYIIISGCNGMEKEVIERANYNISRSKLNNFHYAACFISYHSNTHDKTRTIKYILLCTDFDNLL
jgi:hypothetical protein